MPRLKKVNVRIVVLLRLSRLCAAREIIFQERISTCSRTSPMSYEPVVIWICIATMETWITPWHRSPDCRFETSGRYGDEWMRWRKGGWHTMVSISSVGKSRVRVASKPSRATIVPPLNNFVNSNAHVFPRYDGNLNNAITLLAASILIASNCINVCEYISTGTIQICIIVRPESASV